MIIRYIGNKSGGLAKLKGKTIGFIYLDAGYGREPIPLLQQLAKDYGFKVKLYAVAGKEMQDQSGQWLAVRRDRPDWMIMWGWGAMNPTAVKRASENGYPMDHFIGIWWSGSDDDARGGGQGGQGLSRAQLLGPWRQIPGDPGHQEIRRGQGQEPGREGQVRGHLLQPRRLQHRAGGGSHPQCAEAVGQKSRDWRRRPPRSGNPAHHGGALEGTRLPRVCRAVDRHQLRRPLRSPARLYATVGWRQVGRRCPTGSSR